jgi:hypothetical protein
MTVGEYARLNAKIAVLKEIAIDYSGKTIDNVIQQLEAIREEVSNDRADIIVYDRFGNPFEADCYV